MPHTLSSVTVLKVKHRRSGLFFPNTIVRNPMVAQQQRDSNEVELQLIITNSLGSKKWT